MLEDKTIRIAVSEGTVGKQKYQIIHGYGWNITIMDEDMMFPDKPQNRPPSEPFTVDETYYKGFLVQRVPEKGWRIVLDDVDIMFPYLSKAQAAIDAFYKTIVPKYHGEKLVPEENRNL